jgi:two-component system, sensor histidine kinase and response regulator
MSNQNEKTILVAEDDCLNQRYIKNLLESKGWRVESVYNGDQAIEKLSTHKIDLILMDGRMPKMDGFEAAKIIRENEKTTGNRIPIIALTGYASEEDKEKIRNSGMDDYIIKPIDENGLVNLIRKHLTN